MTTEEIIRTLKNEYTNDPLDRRYSNMTVQEFIESLETPNRTIVIPETRITELGILEAFDNPADGEAFMQKIELVALNNDLIARIIKWVQQERGLDVGNSKTRAVLDSLVGVATITQTEVDTIKALAEKSASRAEELGLTHFRNKYVREAMS